MKNTVIKKVLCMKTTRAKCCFLFVIAFFLIQELAHAQSLAFQWATSFGGSGGDLAASVATDSSGNVFTIGNFSNSADFDPGPAVFILVSNGWSDIFISKLDSNGNFIWAKSIGGWFYDFGYHISVDGDGNIYASGNFSAATDFDPGTGTFTMSPVNPNGNTFLIKLDSAGNFIWAKQINANGMHQTDSAGNVLFYGSFSGVIDADPNAGVASLIAVDSSDNIILKLDSSGNYVWAHSTGGNRNEGITGLTFNQQGHILICGTFDGTCDFDPGIGSYALTSIGGSDIFICKYESNGNFIWAKSLQGSAIQASGSICYDNANRIHICGSFKDSLDADPGIGSYMLTSFGDLDAFSVTLDSAGNMIWGKQLGGNLTEYATHVRVDQAGNVYTIGTFEGNADFDPSAASSSLVASGGKDIFMSKLNPNGDFQWVKQIGGVFAEDAYSLYIEQNKFYLTGYFRDSVDFNPGAGNAYLYANINSDAFIVKLTDCSPTSSSAVYTACDSMLLNGQVYMNSGSYSQSVTNSTGCDSILNFTLSVNYSTSDTVVQTACNDFVWNGITYSISGMYIQSYSSAAGCDSVKTLNLTIQTIDTSVNRAGNAFTANLTGANYQWVLCPAFTNILGANSQSFSAVANGFYAVILTENSCQDTSTCYPVFGIGLQEHSQNSQLNVTPNPTNGILTISSSTHWQASNITLRDIKGQVLWNQKSSDTNRITIDMTSFADGLYWIEFKTMDGTNHLKVLKSARQ